MTTYYVATLANYVLVDATNEIDARQLGRAALTELAGNATPNIRTVRPATCDEIGFWRWSQNAVTQEEQRLGQQSDT